ncbi:MAG: transposase [bacterium]|nr:transposase [bacterium]
MRYEIGTFVHVCARGTRGLPIVHDDQDRWHFLELLYYCNHTESRRNLFRKLQESKEENKTKKLFFWPPVWREREPIVSVVTYALVENHYHLLLQERVENGISRFMQKIGIGFAKYYNQKYKTKGNLFQGRYRAKVVDTDEYLSYVSAYIQAKNILEVYPGGLGSALSNLEKSFQWATEYPFGSLGDYVGARKFPIVEKSVLGDMFSSPASYQKFAKECVKGMNLKEKLGKLTLE